MSGGDNCALSVGESCLALSAAVDKRSPEFYGVELFGDISYQRAQTAGAGATEMAALLGLPSFDGHINAGFGQGGYSALMVFIDIRRLLFDRDSEGELERVF